MTRIVIAALSLIRFATPGVAAAQPVLNIDAHKGNCPGCSITLTKIATLGGPSDDVSPAVAYNFIPVSNSKGHHLVPSLGADQVLVYDHAGKLVRKIGRRGDGPGEFQAVIGVERGVNDSVFVLSVGRLTVYSSSFSLVRTVPLAFTAYGSFVGFANGDFVLDAGSANTAPQALRSVSAKGTAIPYGPIVNKTGARCGRCTAYVVARGIVPEQVWTAGPNTYLLEKRTAKGEVLQQLQVVNSTWFHTWERSTPAGRDIPPPTIVHTLKVDTKGQLWTLGDGPTASWHPMPYVGQAVGGTSRTRSNIPAGGVVVGKEYLDRTFSVLDVMDPITGGLVVSAEFAGRRLKLVSAGIVAEPREDPDGFGVLDIFRAEIKRP